MILHPETMEFSSPVQVLFAGNEVLLTEVMTYLEASSILHFLLSSKSVMEHDSAAAEAVLEIRLRGLSQKDRGRLSHLSGIGRQDTNEKCRLSGAKNWGVCSRMCQIDHLARMRFSTALGGATTDANGSIVRMPKHSKVMSMGFSFTKFVMASGVHEMKFRVAGRGLAGFGIARPLHYGTLVQENKLQNFNPCFLGADETVVKRCYPGGSGGWQSNALINTVMLNNCEGGFDLRISRGAKTEGFSRIELPQLDFPREMTFELVLDMSTNNDGKLSLHAEDGYVCELIDGLEGGFVWIGQVGPGSHNANPSVELVQDSSENIGTDY